MKFWHRDLQREDNLKTWTKRAVYEPRRAIWHSSFVHGLKEPTQPTSRLRASRFQNHEKIFYCGTQSMICCYGSPRNLIQQINPIDGPGCPSCTLVSPVQLREKSILSSVYEWKYTKYTQYLIQRAWDLYPCPHHHNPPSPPFIAT